jgi:hypothetical protein
MSASWSTVVTVTTMLTWQAEDGRGFEGTRLLLGAGHAFRALGRLVRADPEGDFTASYRLVVAEDGAVERLSLTSATAQRERHLTINRTEDGFWLLDTGSGGTRAEFGGAVDVDLEHSAMFNSLPIRRLGLHTAGADAEAGEHSLPMVFVSLPDLEVTLVEQRYRTVSPLSGDTAVVGFRWDEFAADLVVDPDGVVVSYPGVAVRYSVSGVAPAAS